MPKTFTGGMYALKLFLGVLGQTTFVDGKVIYDTGGVFTPPSIQRGKHRAGHGTSPLTPLKHLIGHTFPLTCGGMCFRFNWGVQTSLDMGASQA